jgi:predicted dehydrogenase
MYRREFLKTGIAGAAAFATLQSQVFAAAGDKPLRVALIGCGWYGKSDLLHLIQVAPVEVVALCDVDSRMLTAAAKLVAKRQPSKKQPKTYSDYQKVLAVEQPEIVLVGTPDHWHCLPMIEACKAGADVYCQKPISYDVVEGQAMLAAARKYKRTVQIGLQRRSTPHLLEARDKFIRSGALGKIAYVDVHSYFGASGSFPPNTPPPDYLDWETYVGPAAWREYNPGLHPRGWRAAREFSNGQIGDLCVHFFDLVRYFLELRWPRSIAASGGSLMRDKNPP